MQQCTLSKCTTRSIADSHSLNVNRLNLLVICPSLVLGLDIPKGFPNGTVALEATSKSYLPYSITSSQSPLSLDICKIPNFRGYKFKQLLYIQLNFARKTLPRRGHAELSSNESFNSWHTWHNAHMEQMLWFATHVASNDELSDGE